MSSYDNVPLKQLHEALVEAFNLGSLDMMLQLHLGVTLEHIAPPGRMPHTVLKVLEYYKQRSQIGHLITAAHTDQPTALKLRDLVAQHDPANLQPMPSPPSPSPKPPTPSPQTTVGERGVYVGGNMSGDIITGNQTIVTRGDNKVHEQKHAPVVKETVVPSSQNTADIQDKNSKTKIFISHATQDKDDIARPLAEALQAEGYDVWYDEFSLKMGDSLREEIDKGLATCDYGIVILSEAFFQKKWTKSELNGLNTRQINNDSGNVILPIWHKVTARDVMQFSPPLADRLAVSTHKGIPHIVAEIKRVTQSSTDDDNVTI